MSAAAPAIEVEIPSELTQIPGVIDRLDEFWQAQQLDEDAQADLNIAAEEILSNIIRHGAAAEPIRLSVTIDTHEIRMQFEDAGVEFDPVRHSSLDPAAPLEARRAGGMGIYMVLRLMDRAAYRRQDGRNQLTLTRLRERSGR